MVPVTSGDVTGTEISGSENESTEIGNDEFLRAKRNYHYLWNYRLCRKSLHLRVLCVLRGEKIYLSSAVMALGTYSRRSVALSE